MNRWLQRAYGLLVYAFLYVPLLVVAVFSFNNSKFSLAWHGFTLQWYSKLWENSSLIAAALNSLLIAAASATLATLPTALAASGIRPPALIVVGSVVGLREQLNWFEGKAADCC